MKKRTFLNLNLKKTLALLLAALMSLTLMACAAGSDGKAEAENLNDAAPNGGDLSFDLNYSQGQTPAEGAADKDDSVTDSSALMENPFVSSAVSPISTFSADVDTASYALFRKLASNGYTLRELKSYAAGHPLRTEEMINYFDYAYNLPEEDALFGRTASIAKSPWNDDTYLMVLGLATEAAQDKGANNLVFLIDVSGSMAASDKLPLLKNAFSTLVSALDERDTVSIVTYSGREAVVLDGCAGNRDEQIMNAINGLIASGSTNGESGLQKAYELAQKNFIADGNNRIIMASDGDLNVGISSPEKLKAYISEKRDAGIFLSVLGFGTGNYRDDTMSALAQNGNGVYYYIDSAREAEKVLGTDLLSTLHTVGKDVKLQLTFDAAYVSEYRLIGYETRMLNTEDFNDDTKDAGDVGAGHSLTVCYELRLTEAALSEEGRTADFMKLDIRYKRPEETESTQTEYTLGGAQLTETPTDDFRFVAAVIETVMIINGSAYNAKQINMETVYGVLAALDLADEDKTEFRAMIERLV